MLMKKSSIEQQQPSLPTPPLEAASSGEEDEMLYGGTSSESSEGGSYRVGDKRCSRDFSDDDNDAGGKEEDSSDSNYVPNSSTASSSPGTPDVSPIFGGPNKSTANAAKASAIDCSVDDYRNIVNVVEVQQQALSDSDHESDDNDPQNATDNGHTPFKAKCLSVMFEGIAEDSKITEVSAHWHF